MTGKGKHIGNFTTEQEQNICMDQ